MPNSLSHATLVRSATSSTTARVSADFVVDGESLLGVLVEAHGGHGDLMAIFVHGFVSENAENAKRLTLLAPANSPSGRVLLYVCPECGDIGCGAYSAKVERVGSVFTWADFAYENGYEDPRPINGVGPFVFEGAKYGSAINAASAP